MPTYRPPSHAPLGLAAGASFVLVALAAFASVYSLVLGARAPETSSRTQGPEVVAPSQDKAK